MADKSLRFDVELNSAYAVDRLQNLWEQARTGSRAAAEQVNKELGGQVKKVLDFEVRIDDQGNKSQVAVVKELFTAYDKINNKQNQIEKVQRNSVTSLRQALNTQKQIRDGIAKTVETTNTSGQKTREVNQAWVEANARVGSINLELAKTEGGVLNILKAQYPAVANFLSMGNALSQAVQIVQSLVIVFQQVVGAADLLVQRTKQIQGLTLALGGFLDSQEQVSQVLASAKGVSLTYGASLTQIEQAYKRVTPAILASGGTLGETEDIIASLAARTTQLGLNTEQSGRYIEAFAQVMGKGKLQSEELNQQFSELDGALRSQIASYLASKYGITDLTDAMQKGQVTSALFREAFVDISKAAREKLSVAMEDLQNNIDNLNIQQLENIRNTLNTISIESLAQTFNGFGQAFQRIQTGFAQFFSSITTSLPGLKRLFTEVFDKIGIVLEVVVNGALAGIKTLLFGLDQVVQAYYAVRDAIANNPVFQPVIGAAKAVGSAFINSFRLGVSLINSLGPSVDAATGQLGRQKDTVASLGTAYAAGAISVDEYKRKLEQLRPALDAQQKGALEGFKAEEEALKTLKEQVGEKYDYENEKLEEQKTKKEEALSTEKDNLATILDTLKTTYDARKTIIDEEIAKIKQRYDEELGYINQVTPAQAEELRLRKEKLKATINSAAASYEEKVSAAASLDTMLQQEESARMRARQEDELAVKAAEKAALENQYNADKKAAEEESKARQGELESAIKGLTTALQENKTKQEEINQQIDDSLKLNDKQINKLSEIPALVQAQVNKVNDAKTAYWNATKAVDGLETSIRRAGDAQVRLNNLQSGPGAPNKFAGGPVAGGSAYTVNEFGREGFLSSSGVLSEIKATPWSQWRAPSNGTVIPAGTFAAIKATQTAGGVSGASRIASSVGGSGGLAAALAGLVGGSRDTITNNVTIQSDNTTQAASDMLVQLTKIRRRRYS